MAMVANVNTIVVQTCGVGVLGHFRDVEGALPTQRLLTLTPLGGAGWAIASFTNDPMYEENYKKAERMLKKRFLVVHKSPVRVNKRTGHKFWFYIYDTTKKGEA